MGSLYTCFGPFRFYVALSQLITFQYHMAPFSLPESGWSALALSMQFEQRVFSNMQKVLRYANRFNHKTVMRV